jgi:hypothetical protein
MEAISPALWDSTPFAFPDGMSEPAVAGGRLQANRPGFYFDPPSYFFHPGIDLAAPDQNSAA